MRPSHIVRQTFAGGAANNFNNLKRGPIKNDRMVLGAAGLAAATMLAYYLGYRDVDKRHENDQVMRKNN